MSLSLTPVIAATTQWLVNAYPAPEGVLSGVLAETQARQAVTLASWLRYPTVVDVGLVGLSGPGGTDRLDGLVGTEALAGEEDLWQEPWRSWVDEVVASWALNLLAAPWLSRSAASHAEGTEHMSGTLIDFRHLTEPDDIDVAATPLLRHPDLTAPIAELHRGALLELLDSGNGERPAEISAPVF